MAVEKRKPKPSREVAFSAHEAELLSSAPRRRERPASDDVIELHVCPECGSDLVFPTDWAPAAPRQWHVELRCPDCEWRGDGVYSQDVVDRFDHMLDDGTEAMLDDLTRLTRANMEDEVERFILALRRDLVLPEDF